VRAPRRLEPAAVGVSPAGSNRGECILGEPGSPQTAFVSRMRRNSFLPEHWSGSAYVFEVVIRVPGAD
jgi:hypothetical protein